MTRAETLTQLLRELVGEGRPYTYRQFEQIAVDPETGYRASRSTLNKIALGQPVKVNPSLVRALAAGMGLPLRRVQAAAARQYVGFEVSNPWEGEGDTGPDEVVRVVHRPGMSPEDMPNARAFIENARGIKNSDSE